MSEQGVTPGQTVGPFFGFGLPYSAGPELVAAHRGDALLLHGTVYDGAGTPVPDALLEIWQTGTDGRVPRTPGSLHRDGHAFTGWGRSATDAAGHYRFSTLVPGPWNPEGRSDGQPATATPFISMAVFARGLMDRLFTRVYLPGAPGIEDDPFLSSVAPDRRHTLVAREEPAAVRRFDVHLQGPDETVFLDFGVNR